MGFVKAFIVKGKGAVVVDTGMKNGSKKILAVLSARAKRVFTCHGGV